MQSIDWLNKLFWLFNQEIRIPKQFDVVSLPRGFFFTTLTRKCYHTSPHSLISSNNKPNVSKSLRFPHIHLLLSGRKTFLSHCGDTKQTDLTVLLNQSPTCPQPPPTLPLWSRGERRTEFDQWGTNTNSVDLFRSSGPVHHIWNWHQSIN